MKDTDMHIVFYKLAPAYGGGERCAVEFAKQLARHTRVSIVDPFGTNAAFRNAVQEAGVEYHVVYPHKQYPYADRRNLLAFGWWCAKNYGRFRSLAKRTEALFRKIKPTVCCAFSFSEGRILASRKALRQIPCCYFLHGWFQPPAMTPKGAWLLKNHASRILGVSPATQHACICQGIPKEDVFSLFNPIDPVRFEEQIAEDFQEKLPQNNRAVKLLQASDLRQGKRPDLAIESLRLLRNQGVDAGLWLLGHDKDDPTTGPLMERLKKQISEAELQEYVSFLGHRSDMPQIMKQADICLLPTEYEGHPRVILESMLAGTPFVATPAGGCANMLIPGLTGWQVPFNDAPALVRAVQEIIDNPERTQKIVKIAKEWIQTEFSPETHTRELLNHLIACQNTCSQVS